MYDGKGFDVTFAMDEYRRDMLLRGLDEIGRTLLQEDRIAAFEASSESLVKRFTVAVLPGDGIGPEVTAEAVRVLRAAGDLFGYEFDTAEYPVGAAGVDVAGDSLPQSTRDAVVDADAVLLGAVGHPSLAGAEGKRRPEAGLLALRKLLKAYANLRPVTVHPALSHASPLRGDRLEGVDLLIVRELLGGLYYGEPRSLGATEAVNTLRYTVPEIERVARVAFEAARGRRKLLTSVDKANVLEVSQLWRETVDASWQGVRRRPTRAPVRRFRRDAPRRQSGRHRRAAHGKSLRRHPERRSGGTDGLVGTAAFGIDR